ncbi:hypothetical protein AA309_20285 [Microvirga vignae]|uniref:Uncharacterized protein n=1 Tax=Microvirga vignae TaxID=1225564 RepID=A0A0H1R8R0_9HYPH|nr:hypothetical protein [Microvirga vignae]KLK91434.1 hypothetical protein AA309_20285 [Microvirga vignae]
MADTPSLQETSLTFGGLLLVAGIVWSIFKGRDWLDMKIRAEAVSICEPLKIEHAALKIRVEMLEKDLNEFKVQASKSFVSNDAVIRLEDRLEEGFKSMRAELSDIRETLMKTIIEAGRARS